ncbi:1-aminocyclopropane-1-carboxylate deaminase/D-cysteine desulfhydrase [Vibrio sp. RC27]
MSLKLSQSPVTKHSFEGREFYLKRDDLLHPLFSGNKARKFSELLTYDFSQVDCIIGYGSPQANSLFSLAALAHIKHVSLKFYVSRIPLWLQQTPIGNYAAALKLGAKIIDLSDSSLNPNRQHPSEYIEHNFSQDKNKLCIPEGGRSHMAKMGVEVLGQELVDWITQNSIKNPVIALPSGTGTTALFLQQYLKPHHIDVLTCACVGGNDYLIDQFRELKGGHYPTLLSGKPKHHFGKLYLEDYLIWEQLKHETEVEFDLLYDPLMWQALTPWLEQHSGHTLIYIHQGGLLGNESMEKRYQRKYPALGNLT